MSASNGVLEFRLPGKWLRLDPRKRDESLVAIKAFVARAGSRRDDAAKARALLAESLRATLDRAGEANFQSIFVCEEITDGVPFPVTITVHEPELRMSPAIGTAPEAVISTLRKALVELNVAGAAEASEIELEDSRVLRVVRTQTTALPVDVEGVDALNEGVAEHPTLAVDYWYTRPDTKRFVVASFFTPVADAPHIVSDFFDNIVRASRIVGPVNAEPAPLSS